MADARDVISSELVRAELRRRLNDGLVDKIRQDRYPSATMMDMAEAGLSDDEQFAKYVETLLDKVQSDRFPSIPMLQRIAGLL